MSLAGAVGGRIVGVSSVSPSGPGQDRQGHGEAKGRTLIGTHSSEAHGKTLIGTQMIFAVNFFATSKMSPSESMSCSATRMATAAQERWVVVSAHGRACTRRLRRRFISDRCAADAEPS
jgi:hypothetical protein